MNTQEFIDQKLRLALGNMHVELILAQARITELETEVATLRGSLTQPGPEPVTPPKANGQSLDMKA